MSRLRSSDGIQPTTCRIRSDSVATSNPRTEPEPPVSVVKPMMMRNIVVLPAPFGPTIAQISPSRTVRSTPSSARTGCLMWVRAKGRIHPGRRLVELGQAGQDDHVGGGLDRRLQRMRVRQCGRCRHRILLEELDISLLTLRATALPVFSNTE